MPDPLRVLIIEDSVLDAELILEMLRYAGFDPTWNLVESEADYLEYLRPDLELVLSDYNLPLFDGLRALDLLVGQGFDIPFILISGVIGEDIAVEAMKRGAADYILKDRLSRLGPAVRRSLDERRRRMERKLAGEKLRLQETALDAVSQGVLISDENRRIMYANASFTRLTGYLESEVLGRNCSILQGRGTDPDTVLKMRAALDAGEVFNGEILNYRKNGEPFWNELSMAPMPVEAGQPLRFIGIQRDISDRKQVEAELLWKTALLEAQVYSSPDGVLVVDVHGKKLLQNQRFLDLWQTPADIANDSDDERQRQWSAERTIDPKEFLERIRYLDAHPNESSRDEIELKNGMFFDRYTAPVVGKDGKYYGRIRAFRDITEARIREKKLAEAFAQEKELSEKARAGDRAKSEFLAVMSHEIRTPMNGILGFSELLAESPGLNTTCRDYAKTIASSGEALLRILDDILVFSRMQAGRLTLEKSRFSPAEVLQNIHALLAPQAHDKGLEFRMDLSENIPECLWNDAGRLRQVLLNLVGNAIKFTAVGRITIGARISPETGEAGVDFFVDDTGPGIPEAEQVHIFEAFAQADSSISRRYGGTGLGLSISQNLTELLGGKIQVRSRLGVGSEFSVTLPVTAPHDEGPSVANSPGEPLNANFAVRHPLRVLIVEDDAVNRKLMHLILAKLGYEPLVAMDGFEAVELCRKLHPDCILMDLQMPRMGGLEATREIRRQENGDGRPFIVALTANTVEDDRRQCFVEGMDVYLNKPVKRELLAEALKQASESGGRRSAVTLE